MHDLAARYRAVRSYVRVSSEHQESRGTSLEGQQQAHRRFAASAGLPTPTFYIEVESGSEAATELRDEQLRLQREAEPGDLILVTVVDRWSRDVPHAILSARAAVKRGVGWIAFEEGIDASTSEGMLMLSYRAIAAEQELQRIRDRMVGGRRRLSEQGLYVFGRVPFGYKREGRRLVRVPAEVEVAHHAARLALAGLSCADIAPELPAARNHPTWSPWAVHRLLTSRYLLGEARTMKAGPWRADVHPAVLDRATWERVQVALRGRVAGGRKYAQGDSAHRLLRGLAWCRACGRRVSVRFGARHQRPDEAGRRAHYYVCRGTMAGECQEGWLRAPAVDAETEGLILARVGELREELARPPSPPARARHDPAAEVTAALARVESRKRRAIDLATEGSMPAAVLRETLARYEDEARTLRARAARLEAERVAEVAATDPERRAGLLRSMAVIRAAWEAAPVEERRAWLTILAARVEVGREGVRCQWREIAELTAIT